jgi:pyruvate ferredoxin oxidoreductase alpha subunit
MAECLHYASGGRFPIVMMNANRALALPWSIYGDHRDSMSLLDSGWIQVYAEDAQESLDMIIQAYAIAENPRVLTPVMLNLDGYILTHTYELVEIPSKDEVDRYLPAFETPYKMDLDNPKNMGFSSSPADNMEFKYQQNKAALDARKVIKEVDESFYKAFGRGYGGLIDAYRCDDAEFIMVSLGSTTGTARAAADELRNEGLKAGVLRIRFMRPFPEDELIGITGNAKAIGVIDRDISFGYEGTVFTNVNSALHKIKRYIPSLNFIAGLGGRDISRENIREAFIDLKESIEGKTKERVKFLGLGVSID